jgi:HEPN domain-containing protein
MDEFEYALEWLNFAEMDLSSSKHLLMLRPLPIEIVCFHCQQTAEKMLKAFIVLQNVIPPKIHNLIELCTICEQYNATFTELEPKLKILNQYSVTPRYPGEFTLFEHDANTAIKYAEAVLNFTKPFFPQKNEKPR